MAQQAGTAGGCFPGRLGAGLVAVLLALPGWSHDFWIEAAPFRPAPGDSVLLTLRVGEDFAGTSQPWFAHWFLDFTVTAPAGARAPIIGLAGDDPAGRFLAGAAGLYLVGYHSTRSFTDLPADRFEAYLRQEGLERILARRLERGEAGSNAREFYSRCAKALVLAGPGPGAGHDRVLGYPLELIPLANPYALAPGATLPVLLAYEGKPIGGVLVVAFTAEDPARQFSARTDQAGRVALPLDRGGTWLIKAVHMIELAAGHPEADWESFWASLTFGLATRP